MEYMLIEVKRFVVHFFKLLSKKYFKFNYGGIEPIGKFKADIFKSL